MELIPKDKQPVAGSEGAQYRKKQLAKQLPAHDQDPSKCHELSPNEVKQMEQFVKKYKNEVLGVGDVKLPKDLAVQAGDQSKPDNGARSTLTTVKGPENKAAAPQGSAYVSSCTVWYKQRNVFSLLLSGLPQHKGSFIDCLWKYFLLCSPVWYIWAYRGYIMLLYKKLAFLYKKHAKATLKHKWHLF